MHALVSATILDHGKRAVAIVERRSDRRMERVPSMFGWLEEGVTLLSMQLTYPPLIPPEGRRSMRKMLRSSSLRLQDSEATHCTIILEVQTGLDRS